MKKFCAFEKFVHFLKITKSQCETFTNDVINID